MVFFTVFMVEVLVAVAINVAMAQKLSYHEPALYAELGKPSGLGRFSPWHCNLGLLVENADQRVMKHGIHMLLRRYRQMSLVICITILAWLFEIARS